MTESSVCALVSSFTTRKYDEWKNEDTSSHHPNTCCVVALHQTDSVTEQTSECYSVLGCSHDELHCAVEGLAPSPKQWLIGVCLPWDIWWWEVACRFCNVPRDICQVLWSSSNSTCLSRQFIQVNNICEWCKRHSVIRFERAANLEWRCISRSQIWIAFQTTSPWGLDLISKNQIWYGLLLFRLPDINLDSVWICQKSSFGWQSEQGHRNNWVNTHP